MRSNDEQSSLDFWNRHSLKFLEMAFETHRRERLEKPDGHAKATRECGDTVEFFLLLRDTGTLGVSFEIEGCLYSLACANAAAHLAEGKTVSEARRIDGNTIKAFLETLPEVESHCADLAAEALHLALDDLRAKRT